jgi:predicted cupin superfamily sugar epimerase
LTTIYYLLEKKQLSRWHVVQADEIWHFYGGAPLELLAYTPDTRAFERHVLGHVGAAAAAEHGVAGTASALAATAGGAISVSVIPTGVWQAARSLGEYSLVGCTVGPGFEFSDFQFVSALPSHAGHFCGDLARYSSLL